MDDLVFEGLGDLEGGAFGGKAEGLAHLWRSGLPVPAGFAVSATITGPGGWSEAARAEFLARCRRLLADGPIAVRSSALGEDAADRSFAGLFRSVLNVATEGEALAAAATCIASGAAERVLAYGGRSEPMAVGLVVQRMVAARAAGVAFSRDPAGRDPAIVVEAVAGLGEELVSGRATPESWRVYPTGLGDLDARRSGPATVLPAERARAIAAVARRTAEDWGQDLDLEWALDAEGALWWLQARPITTGSAWRPPVVRRSAVDPDDGPVSVWSNINVRESMPDPIHPLSWSVWKASLAPVITRAMIHLDERSPAFARASGVDLVDGRLTFNLNAFLATPVLGRLMLHLPSPLDDRSDRSIRDLARRGVLRPRRNPGATGAFLRGLLPRRDPFPSRRDPEAWLAALAAGAAAIQARPPVSGLSDEALIEEILVLSRPEAAVLRAGLGMANRLAFVWMLSSWLFRPWPGAASRLAAGVTGNPTTAISLGVDRLVQLGRPLAAHFAADRPAPDILADLRAAGPTDAAARAWLEELDAFLREFGHRAPREFDLATPRWLDDPAMVVDLVRAGLAAPVGETLAERLARLRSERDEAVAAAIQAARPWRRPLLRWAAGAVPRWMPLREAPKHQLMRTFQRARAAALELGRRLAERGVLVAAEDVFLLELEELAAIDRQERPVLPDLARRREDLARWALATPDTVIRSDGVPVVEDDPGPADPRELRGNGIGGGVGEGPVNILETPDPRLVRDGDVLVVTFADPGWTPLFPRAAAVVMEVGGTMCHAAVVARELGIPSVFAVCDAKLRLRPGERVRVDGDAGRVTRLEAAR